MLESAGLDPMGPYTFKYDMLDPQQDNTWNDSILQLNGQLYLMGTFFNGSQPTFIRPLGNPWTASGTGASSSRRCRGRRRAAPSPKAGTVEPQRRTFIVYSASHCSTPTQLGIAHLPGRDPLLIVVVKVAQPGVPAQRHGVYGPGTTASSSPRRYRGLDRLPRPASATAGCASTAPRRRRNSPPGRHDLWFRVAVLTTARLALRTSGMKNG